MVKQNNRYFPFFSVFCLIEHLFDQHLAATSTYANLDVPLCDILHTIHDQNTYTLATCKMNDQLFELMDKFVTREVNTRPTILSLIVFYCQFLLFLKNKENIRFVFSFLLYIDNYHAKNILFFDLGSSFNNCK